MLLSLSAILPIFLMITLGYVAKHTVLDIKLLPGLNQFVYYFALPALLFNAASQQQLSELINAPALIAASTAIVLTVIFTGIIFIYGFKIKHRSELILRALSGVFANFAYMGIPLTFGILGEAAYAATISIVLLGNIVIINGSQLLLAANSQESLNAKAVVAIVQQSLLRNPLFIAPIMGLVFSHYQLPPPTAVQQLLDMLAPAAIPVALFCLGASLQFTLKHSGFGQIFTLVAIKLVLHPALTLACFHLFQIDDSVWLISTVLLCALPTGALAHVIALKQQSFIQETSQVIVLSTVLSLFSVSLWTLLLL